MCTCHGRGSHLRVEHEALHERAHGHALELRRGGSELAPLAAQRGAAHAQLQRRPRALLEPPLGVLGTEPALAVHLDDDVARREPRVAALRGHHHGQQPVALLLELCIHHLNRLAKLLPMYFRPYNA